MSDRREVGSGGGPTGLQLVLIVFAALAAVLAVAAVWLNPYWIGAIS